MGEKKYEHVKEDFIFNFFASYFLEKYIYVYNDFYSQFNDDFKKKYKKSFFDDFIDEIERYINEKEKNSTSIPYNILILTLLKGKYKELKQVIYKIFEDHRGQIDHFKGLTNELEVLENYEKYSKYISENFELQENTNLLLSKIDLVKEKDINDYYKIADENRFFSELFSYEKLYINFLDSTSHITYNQLSTGEKSLITFFSNYTYTLILRNENRIILIDEVESFLHPRWQKEIIHLLIEYIQYLEKEELIKINRFHLIVTSHSPFLLSDIPKDNIIFLEKGKEVYPFTKEEQTFGANIHTLMSHGFFMKKSGLMGKFAQNQINKVIEDLQKKETILSQQKIKSIIEIVGEPFLKYKLMQMYNDKFPLEDEISELEYENKILEKKQRKNAERIKSLKEEEGKNATT